MPKVRAFFQTCTGSLIVCAAEAACLEVRMNDSVAAVCAIVDGVCVVDGLAGKAGRIGEIQKSVARKGLPGAWFGDVSDKKL